ncbi:MAG: SPOR domain-containing protein [Cyclobacteriaceae bacterium]
MKKGFIAICTAFLLLATISVEAADKAAAKKAKAEAKEWKKKLKSLDVASYKKLLEEKEAAESEKSSYLAQLDALDAENTNLKNQTSQLKASLSQMEEEINAKASEPIVEVAPIATTPSGNNMDQGVAFKVQIGSFKTLGSAASLASGNDNFGAESDGDNNKYTIGAFRSYQDADLMKKYLRKMGVRDAWIVSYKDGNRVSIKEVADYINE